jgi:hypothetical protein
LAFREYGYMQKEIGRHLSKKVFGLEYRVNYHIMAYYSIIETRPPLGYKVQYKFLNGIKKILPGLGVQGTLQAIRGFKLQEEQYNLKKLFLMRTTT